MIDCSCGWQVDKNCQLKARKMFHLKEKENILSDILRYIFRGMYSKNPSLRLNSRRDRGLWSIFNESCF